jgi:phosphatidylserine synthase 2
VLSVDCNNFFLKFIVWVPPDHGILKVRLALWAFSALAATKEYYEFISNPYCKRVGPFIWLTSFTLLIEFSFIVKFGSVMFTEPFPWYVQVMWAIIGVFVVIGAIVAYINERKQVKKPVTKALYNLQDPSLDIEPLTVKKNN